MSLIDKIANTIRTVDGSNTMGAVELAKHIAAALPYMIEPLEWDGFISGPYKIEVHEGELLICGSVVMLSKMMMKMR